MMVKEHDDQRISLARNANAIRVMLLSAQKGA
jgi:hypothetical protein